MGFHKQFDLGGFLGLGPQSQAPLDENNSIKNDVIMEESIDELTKKLEDVALERNNKQTMKNDSNVRPTSGESNNTVIDLITNDLQQGMIKCFNSFRIIQLDID